MAQATHLNASEIAQLRNAIKKRTKVLIKCKIEAEAKTRELANGVAAELSRIRTHPADLASMENDQKVASDIVDRFDKELRELTTASERLEFGKFGLCRNCEEPIPFTRLIMIPETQVCGPCKAAMEKDERDRRHISQRDR
jgi:RNA polymerase-binding transcription factor DksA